MPESCSAPPSISQSEPFFELSLDPLGDGGVRRLHQARRAVPYVEFIHADDRERTVAEASRLASPGAETHRRPDHGAIVDLTHALGLRAVGEGVERAGQREVLRALGCDVAQGLYFGRPQPPEVAEALAGRSPRY